jgi:hypothetical protein
MIPIFSPSIENLKKHMILSLLLFNVPFWLHIYVCVKTSLFISLCILRDLLQQDIPMELCGGGRDPPVFLRSHVPMKRFFDEMDQENSKKQEGKNGGNEKKRF